MLVISQPATFGSNSFQRQSYRPGGLDEGVSAGIAPIPAPVAVGTSQRFYELVDRLLAQPHRR